MLEDHCAGTIAKRARMHSLIGQARSTTGKILYRAYGVTTTNLPAPTVLLDARMGDLAQLIGYDLGANPRTGEPLTVTLYARAEQQAKVEGENKFFVHLRDATGYIWSEDEGIGGDSAQWNRGETVLTWFTLPIPPDAPPKNYQLEIGMYSLTRGRIPVVDDHESEHSARGRSEYRR